MNNYNLQECVEKFVESRRLTNPGCSMSEHVANAYHHCRNRMKRGGDSLDFDSKRYVNQILASEGVLEYSNGRMLKKWDSLKNFVGKMVPIIDEHPDSNNGNDGRISGKEKIHGIGLIKQCIVGEPVLCFDSVMNDDAPTKRGYSIGFVYKEENESGDHYGSQYDGVQNIQEIDHIALTNYPRNAIALSSTVGSDSLQGLQEGSNEPGNYVVKYYLGYDSFKVFKENSDTKEFKNSDGTMPEKEEKMKEKEEGDEEEEKEEEMDEEEEEKKDKGFPFKKKGSDSELERLRKALADTVLERDSLKVEKILIEKDSKKYRKQLETYVADSIKVGIDSLVKKHDNLEKIDFDGKSKQFIEGMIFMDSKFNEEREPESSVEGSEEIASDAILLDHNQAKWDMDSGKFIKKGE